MLVSTIGEANVVISVDTAKSLEIGVCLQCNRNLVAIVVRMVELDTNEPDLSIGCCFACWPEYFTYLYSTHLKSGLLRYFVCVGEY